VSVLDVTSVAFLPAPGGKCEVLMSKLFCYNERPCVGFSGCIQVYLVVAGEGYLVVDFSARPQMHTLGTRG
jgi:hypothetical protein